jgi:hypothetical protein
MTPRLAGALITLLVAGVALVALPSHTAAQVPRPFPGAGAPRPGNPVGPADPAPAPSPPEVAPVAPGDQRLGGTPVYPTAEFIDVFDAGYGQQYFLYGTNIPYDDIVAYYRSVLDNGGREIFREPAMRQFDLGRFRDDRMAFPPSVVVKDYSWNGSAGYPAVVGTTEKRFRTIIQIVPPTEAP